MSGATKKQWHLNQTRRIDGEKITVIYGIKGSREIKETKSSDYVLSDGLDDVVVNRK